MITIIITLVISFLLDGLMSNYLSFSINNPSLFNTVYIIVALTCLYPIFNDDKKYFLFCLLFGLLFDIGYTNTFLLNTISFLLVGLVNKVSNYSLPYNIVSNSLKGVIAVCFYYIITNIILLISSYHSYMVMPVIKILYSSLIMSIIYSTLIYLIFNGIIRKKSKLIIK